MIIGWYLDPTSVPRVAVIIIYTNKFSWQSQNCDTTISAGLLKITEDPTNQYWQGFLTIMGSCMMLRWIWSAEGHSQTSRNHKIGWFHEHEQASASPDHVS